MSGQANWYESWFNSPYYHILYCNRNDEEAHAFINTLLEYIKPAADSRFLDLACGKGRHSRFLNERGYDVTGIDLSTESIKFAAASNNDHLNFYVHDMRRVFRVNYYDYVLNLFTSMGYFDSGREDEQVIRSIHSELKHGGLFILDYLNAEYWKPRLIKEENKTAGGIEFHIRKHLEDGCFVKNISFKDKAVEKNYTEKVRAYSRGDLQRMTEKAGFKVEACFGEYDLSEFNETLSRRVILFCRK